MSGAFDFCDASGTCPESFVGEKVGVGGGDSGSNLLLQCNLRKKLSLLLGNWISPSTYLLRVVSQTSHFACWLLLLSVRQAPSVDHVVLFHDGFGPPLL